MDTRILELAVLQAKTDRQLLVVVHKQVEDGMRSILTIEANGLARAEKCCRFAEKFIRLVRTASPERSDLESKIIDLRSRILAHQPPPACACWLAAR